MPPTPPDKAQNPEEAWAVAWPPLCPGEQAEGLAAHGRALQRPTPCALHPLLLSPTEPTQNPGRRLHALSDSRAGRGQLTAVNGGHQALAQQSGCQPAQHLVIPILGPYGQSAGHGRGGGRLCGHSWRGLSSSGLPFFLAPGWEELACRYSASPGPGAGGVQPSGQQERNMGLTPDPHGTPTPAGTTATPGLVPDLVSRTPWPGWGLVALALAVGVLAVTCLLCALHCRRRQRRRKQPGDKETVGLGRISQSCTAAHLVQPDVDAVEASAGGQQWGRVLLSLEYDFGSQEIKVGLKRAADLQAEGTADPYARLSISTQAGRGHESKVHRGTLCPVFEETCRFPVPQEELPRAALQVRLLDFRRFSEHEPLGELHLPLAAVDLQHVLERWYQLGPPGTAEPERSGALCLSLQYVPGSGRLTVVVLEARGLGPGLAESYVKVQLVLKQRKWKKRTTSPRKGTAAPYFNQAFSFPVPVGQIQSVDLVLAVWARGPHLRAEPVGKVLLGARASGQSLQHWADMLAHARRPITQWHSLRPPKEVDAVLALKPRLRLPVPGS
ncbi:PREDICTED: synaptotagmin-8 [Dipodomys ordii]|uniref:Synaptotagmin-8 n=1 Tax=Dipodomys ordii TaxID=10020 RepID=A0A1S3FJ15_DIPOR|nr:PREDICTED: synaptotagmin-8 [Dipodomys ordii]